MSKSPRSKAVPSLPPVWRRKSVLKLLIVALLAETGYALLNISTMPVYLRHGARPFLGSIPDGRSMGESVIGFVLAAFLISEAAFKGYMGALADRYGYKTLMLAGPIITTFTSALTLAVPYRSPVLEGFCFVALRCFDGVGAAMMWPAMFSLVGHSVDDRDRQQAMSMLNLCYLLGIAIALPLGGIVNDVSGYKWASLILTSLLFACVATAVWRLVPHVTQTTLEKKTEETSSMRALFDAARKIPTYLVLAVVTFAGIGFPMAIIKIFAHDEMGMSEAKFGALVLPGALAMAALSVPLSKLADRVGRAKAVHYGMALCALGLSFIAAGAFFSAMRVSWVFAAGGIPVGIGFLMTIPAWMASVSDIDPKRRGVNLGAVMTAQGVGAIIGAPIGSTLYEELRPYGRHLAHYSPLLGCALFVTFGWLLSIKLIHGGKGGER